MEIAIALLQHYSFDLGGYTIRDLNQAWSKFRPEWVRQAVIEALFQGRYKAVSVDQILQLWERKGEPNYRYNREFERLVCGDVAVIYEDRIFYTAPRASSRDTSVSEIAPFAPVRDLSPLVPTAMQSNSELHQPSSKYLSKSETRLAPETRIQKYPAVKPSGTTASQSYTNVQTDLDASYSEAYRSAYTNMTLLAETSMFVDKLRSMCGDRLVLPVPQIESSQQDLAKVSNAIAE